MIFPSMNLLSDKVLPFCLSIDSEYVDIPKVTSKNIFDNERINMPLTLGVSLILFGNTRLNFFKTYVFNMDNYRYLKKNVQNNFFNKGLEYVHYNKVSEFPFFQEPSGKLLQDNFILIRSNNSPFQKNFEFYLEEISSVSLDHFTKQWFFITPLTMSIGKYHSSIQVLPIIWYYSVKDIKYFFNSEIFNLFFPYLDIKRNTTFP